MYGRRRIRRIREMWGLVLYGKQKEKKKQSVSNPKFSDTASPPHAQHTTLSLSLSLFIFCVNHNQSPFSQITLQNPKANHSLRHAERETNPGLLLIY